MLRGGSHWNWWATSFTLAAVKVATPMKSLMSGQQTSCWILPFASICNANRSPVDAINSAFSGTSPFEGATGAGPGLMRAVGSVAGGAAWSEYAERLGIRGGAGTSSLFSMTGEGDGAWL